MSVCAMKKLTVLSPERDADRLVRRLVRLRCAEITSVPLGKLPDGGTLLRYDSDAARSEAERRVSDVTAALSVLDAYTVKAMPWTSRPIVASAEDFVASGRFESARATVSEVLALRDKRMANRNEYNRLQALSHALTPWMDYPRSLGGEVTVLCEIWLGTLPPKTLISAVDAAIGDLHAGVEEISRDADALHVSVLTMKEDADATARALATLGFIKVSFKGLLSDGTAAENLGLIARRLGELEAEQKTAENRLRALVDRIEDLKILSDMEATTLVAANQKQKLAATDQCVVLEAWVPAERDARVAAALDKLPCAYDMEDLVFCRRFFIEWCCRKVGIYDFYLSILTPYGIACQCEFTDSSIIHFIRFVTAIVLVEVNGNLTVCIVLTI